MGFGIDTYGGGRKGNVSYATDRGMVRTGPSAPTVFNRQRPLAINVNDEDDDYGYSTRRTPSIHPPVNRQGNTALPDPGQLEAVNRETLRAAEAARRSDNFQKSLDRTRNERWTREGMRALTHGTTADSQRYGNELLERAGRASAPSPQPQGMTYEQTQGYKNLRTGDNPVDDATAMARVGAATQPTAQPEAPAFSIDANKRRVDKENADLGDRPQRRSGLPNMTVTSQQAAAMRAAAPNDAAFKERMVSGYNFSGGAVDDFIGSDPSYGTGQVARPDLAVQGAPSPLPPRSMLGTDTGGPRWDPSPGTRRSPAARGPRPASRSLKERRVLGSGPRRRRSPAARRLRRGSPVCTRTSNRWATAVTRTVRSTMHSPRTAGS
jgi:hypothetical protein